jgi:hypothetical protein
LDGCVASTRQERIKVRIPDTDDRDWLSVSVMAKLLHVDQQDRIVIDTFGSGLIGKEGTARRCDDGRYNTRRHVSLGVHRAQR